MSSAQNLAKYSESFTAHRWNTGKTSREYEVRTSASVTGGVGIV
jgi:hypothetical protein